MHKGIKKIWFIALVLFIPMGCGRQLAPSTVPEMPGQSKLKAKRMESQRAWAAYWHHKKTEKLTSKAEAKSVKSDKQAAKAEKSLVERHIKNQTPEVQERMKASQKEAEKNRPKRTLRQRLGFWKYK